MSDGRSGQGLDSTLRDCCSIGFGWGLKADGVQRLSRQSVCRFKLNPDRSIKR